MLQNNGGNGPVALQARLDTWRNRGCRELEHAPDFCHALGLPDFFPPLPPPAAQSTWDKLTKIYLAARLDREATMAEVRDFRIREFGRDEPEIAQQMRPFTLIELFPLPSPDTGAWPYGHLATELPFLINRDTYRHSVFVDRATTLRRKLMIHKPFAVLCYSKVYRELFEGAFGMQFPAPNNPAGIRTIVVGTTQIFLTDHVVAFGMGNAQLTAIGQAIRQELSPAQQAIL